MPPSMSNSSMDVFRPLATIIVIFILATLFGLCSAQLRHNGLHKLRGFCMNARALGMLLIFVVVVLWTGSSVVIQLVFESAHYRKPFFLTYYSTCMLIVYLPFYPRRVARLTAAFGSACGICSRHRRTSGASRFGAYERVAATADSTADPFGLDHFLSEAQKGNKGKPLDGIGAGSGMAASTGGSMSGEGGSGRSKIGFAKEKK